ncbi:MAG TPA: hypothetical protein PLO00_04410, partial [Usitatibacteraceae bacterium]|nr:hypothetical protein [Usitatibacteraceae bacterium]
MRETPITADAPPIAADEYRYVEFRMRRGRFQDSSNRPEALEMICGNRRGIGGNRRFHPALLASLLVATLHARRESIQ